MVSDGYRAAERITAVEWLALAVLVGASLGLVGLAIWSVVRLVKGVLGF